MWWESGAESAVATSPQTRSGTVFRCFRAALRNVGTGTRHMSPNMQQSIIIYSIVTALYRRQELQSHVHARPRTRPVPSNPRTSPLRRVSCATLISPAHLPSQLRRLCAAAERLRRRGA